MNELIELKTELEKKLDEAIRATKDYDDEYDHGYRNGLRVAINTTSEYITGVEILRRLESLESEYNAYHTKSDYWRGIKYAIDVLRRG